MTIRVLSFMHEPERSSFGFARLAEAVPGVVVDEAGSLAELGPQAGETQVLVSIGPFLGSAAEAGAIYRALPNLQWAQSFGTGVDNIKGHPDLPPGCVVTNIQNVHGPQMAEAAFTAMLNHARHTREMAAAQAAGQWAKQKVTRLLGRTLCIIGIGAIAAHLARRAKAFDMRVTGVSSVAREVEHFDNVHAMGELHAALAGADYVVLLTPRTPATVGLINAAAFAAMKPTAYLVNLARGGVIDEVALLAALDAGQLAGASLDVFATEPLPAADPLWRHPKVIVTPHNGGFHADIGEEVFAIIARNLAHFASGGVAALDNRV